MKIFLEEEQLHHLLLQLKQGSETAFNTLYFAYSKALYKKINAIVKDESVADELLQDLFLKIWEKRADLKPEHSFTAFLYTIANNLVYDYFRKVAKDKRLQERLLINAVDYYLHTEENMMDKETGGMIAQAIAGLSDQRRKVFTLCKIEGRSYQETADMLGISVATVNTHMVNAIRQVKAYLYKHQELAVLLVLEMMLRSR